MKRFAAPVASLLLIIIAHAFFMNDAAGEPSLRIVIIGDSTVQTYPPDSDKRGWGQMIGRYFTESAEIVNLAKSGRSTKTFIEEGLWEKAKAERGDYILIQFGHNDSHAPGRPESTDAATDYREYLRRYAREARMDGTEPVFVTPMHRRRFDGNGRPTVELLPYAEAMKAVAAETGAMLIDLHELSGRELARLGDEGSAVLSCDPDDRTHFSPKGAALMARLVAEDLAARSPRIRWHMDLDPPALRHVVLFSFKEGTDESDIAAVERAFGDLPEKIPAIQDFEWGTNVSPENLARGYTHCFLLTFLTEADRDAYLPHPAHKAFGRVLGPHVESVLVVDYLSRGPAGGD